MVATVAVATAAPASAASPDGCAPDAGYTFSTTVHNFVDIRESAEGAGGTGVSITILKGTGTTGTIGGSLTTTEGVFFASAQEQVSASIARTKTAGTNYGYSWVVPKTWAVGYLHAGGDRAGNDWTYGAYNGSCHWVVTNRGHSNLPYHVPASWHNKQAVGGVNQN